SHSQHWNVRPVPVQHGWQFVVTLSQVTDPAWPGQAALVAEQFAASTLLEQETWRPNWQVAVAVQRALPCGIPGFWATWRTAAGCAAQELAAGRPRIAARASWVSGAWLCVWPKPAIETKRREQARIDAFFIISSFQWFHLRT